MPHQFNRIFLVLLAMYVHTSISTALAEEKSDFYFHSSPGEVEVFCGKQLLTTYYYNDSETTRPYFAHVKTLQGTQVTRNHPPSVDDPQDHAKLHPGIFLSFGDISGNDYWRLKAKVKHHSFVKSPNQNKFTVRNQYLSSKDNSIVCTEVCSYLFIKQLHGYLIECKSTFQSESHDFSFGDQEEMGLGIRVASVICEKGGNGRILSSQGIVSAKKTWGQEAKWCDYSGTIGNNQVGVMIMASPVNSRPTWWHNRDYGIFVANLFGRKAMQQGTTSKLIVKQGKLFQLNYGIYVHESPTLNVKQLTQTYQQYVNGQ